MSSWPARFCVFAVVTLAGCDRKWAPPGTIDKLPELVIVRSSPTEPVIEEEEAPPVTNESGDLLFTEDFIVPPNFLSSTVSGSSAAPDPFAPASGGLPVHKTAREVLEDYGITFGPDASAIYSPASGKVIVRNTRDQLELVEALLEHIGITGETLVVNIRAEIYEVPARLALELEQSASEHHDHVPELEAMVRLVDQGEARFVTSANIQARSGQRAKYEDRIERIFVTDYRLDVAAPGEKKPMIPEFEHRYIGTFFEVDPVIGPDNATIDLNLSLEHHTAPPTEGTMEVRFPGEDKPTTLTVPEFHQKSIVTAEAMLAGTVKLLGSWHPTGRPEFASRNLMQVVFLKVDLQHSPAVMP